MLEKVNINYDIRVSDDKSYVIGEIKQDLSAQTALDLTKDSVDIANQFGINCFLFDLRNITNNWGIWENYQFAQELGNYGRKRQDKVALIIDAGNNTHSFLETVTVNQGYNTRLFTDYNKALAWLKE